MFEGYSLFLNESFIFFSFFATIVFRMEQTRAACSLQGVKFFKPLRSLLKRLRAQRDHPNRKLHYDDYSAGWRRERRAAQPWAILCNPVGVDGTNSARRERRDTATKIRKQAAQLFHCEIR